MITIAEVTALVTNIVHDDWCHPNCDLHPDPDHTREDAFLAGTIVRRLYEAGYLSEKIH